LHAIKSLSALGAEFSDARENSGITFISSLLILDLTLSVPI
jgi:hypothetical protein